MLKYRLNAYNFLDNPSTNPLPYKGICKAGLTILDLKKSFPAEGLNLGICHTDKSVDEAVAKIKEYVNIEDLVLYCQLDWVKSDTTLFRNLTDNIYPITPLTPKYELRQDDENVKLVVGDGTGPFFYYKNERGETVKESCGRIFPKVYKQTGSMGMSFLASDNTPDGEVPIDFNLYEITITFENQAYIVKQKTVTKGSYGADGWFSFVRLMKTSEPYIPKKPDFTTYCISDNISYPLWGGEPDWKSFNIKGLPGGTIVNEHNADDYGYFANAFAGAVPCISCLLNKISIISPDYLTHDGSYDWVVQIYRDLIKNTITANPKYINMMGEWFLENNTETIKSKLTVTPALDVQPNLVFTNYDKEVTSDEQSFKVQTDKRFGHQPAYTGFMVFKDIEPDGTFTEFSSVYIALLFDRKENDPQFKTNRYGVVFYHKAGNAFNYWTPNPWLKTLFVGKKFDIVGRIPGDENGDDPFGPGTNKPVLPGDGETGPGGGGGSHDGNSDAITLPDFPSVENQIISAGWSHAWCPTNAERKQLGAYLFSQGFVDSFKKQYANPMDVMLKSHVIPLDPVKGAAKNVVIAGIDTGVSLTSLANQYREYDLGGIFIPMYWNSFLDFEPYTSIELYLPFVGTYKLNTYDVINKTINIKYRVDFATGNCLAVVLVDNVPMYLYNSNIAHDVPIASSVYNGFTEGLFGVLGGAVSVTAGAMTGQPLAIAGGALSMAQGASNFIAPDVKHAGNVGGNVGYMSPNYAYVRIVRPVTAIPRNYGREKGYTSNITRRLGELSGYTVIDQVHIENITATHAELREIESLLKGGIIL